MKFEYDYVVHNISSDGFATVEYKSPTLGSITRTFFVPYKESETIIRRVIVERFPLDLFYSRYYRKMKYTVDDFDIRGKMSIDFDDHFYDIQVETVETILLNEKEDTKA